MTSVSLSSSLVFVPSVVAEASIGVASSADIVFCRFVGGLGEVMLNNRLVLKRLNDETIKGDVGYCTVVLRVVEIDSNSKLLYSAVIILRTVRSLCSEVRVIQF